MSISIIKPPRLNKGDTIGIFSPSQSVIISKEDSRAFEKGIKRLENFGFKVKISPHAKGKYFYSSGTPQERIDDFHGLIKDFEVKAVLMSIGGETANEILPLLNFDLIKDNPKIILGMSDGATLLSPISDKTGLVTFYGPDLIYSFGKQTGTEVFDNQLFKILMEGKVEFKELSNLVDDNKNSIDSGWATIRTGQSTGKLAGGYLEIIQNLIGAGYFKNFQDSILYLESMEGSNTIHMRLQYLKLLGVFDKIKGLILGYFPDIKRDDKYYRPIGDIILELTKDKNFPILQVNELGHMVKNYTWPNGIQVKLDAKRKEILALESPVL